jgi:hypothetical protein
MHHCTINEHEEYILDFEEDVADASSTLDDILQVSNL